MSAKEKPSAAPAASPGSPSSDSKHSVRGVASESPQAKATRGRNKNDRAPGEPLHNQRHEMFCQVYAITHNASEAYRKAINNGENADVLGPRMLGTIGIRERIAEIRGETAERVRKSRDDVIDLMADTLDGRKVLTREQLKAAEILNKMCGWNEPEKVEQKLTVEVIKL